MRDDILYWVLWIIAHVAEAYAQEYAKRCDKQLAELKKVLEKEKEELRRTYKEMIEEKRREASELPPEIIGLAYKHGIPVEELR